jgi:hypothetical protein
MIGFAREAAPPDEHEEHAPSAPGTDAAFLFVTQNARRALA